MHFRYLSISDIEHVDIVCSFFIGVLVSLIGLEGSVYTLTVIVSSSVLHFIHS